MNNQTLISCLSLHLSRFQRRSGQQSMLSCIIKNVIVYFVIFSGKKMKMAIIGTVPVVCLRNATWLMFRDNIE